MTNTEFKEWAKAFFVRFPSVNEWIQKSSPEPEATLRYWRETLGPYSLAECSAVLEQWQQADRKAFQAYDRDNIPTVIKNTIERFRQKQRDREQVDRERHYRNQGRQSGTSGESSPVAIVGTLQRLGLKAAFLRLQPLHKKMLAGEMTEQEYEILKENVLQELED